MKKIQNLFILSFLTFVLLVRVDAYTKIDYLKFENKMNDKGYSIVTLSNAVIAFKEDSSGMRIEEYSYFDYNNENEAKESLNNFYNIMLTIPNYHLNDALNYNIDTNSKEGFIAYDFEEDGSIIHSYCYIYRVENIIIFGSADISLKDIVDNNVNELLEVTGKESKTNEKVDKADKVSNQNDVLFYLIGLFFIGLGIVFVVLGLKKRKQRID